MRFSIIIPNYNKAQYVEECLDSIFSQTIEKEKYEVLFVDDGSTDNSVEIASKYDVKILKSNRKRAGGARNKGIDSAQGEYIIFLDSDDYLYSNDVLEKLDKHITNEDCINLPFMREKKDSVVLYCDKGLSIEEKIAKTKLLACYTRCLRKDVLSNIRFFEECYYEDVLFSMQVLCTIKNETDFEYPFLFYRLVEGSITKSEQISAKKMIDVFLQISNLYYLCDQFPKYSKYILERIKNDRLEERLKILNEYFETGNNTFDERIGRNK